MIRCYCVFRIIMQTLTHPNLLVMNKFKSYHINSLGRLNTYMNNDTQSEKLFKQQSIDKKLTIYICLIETFEAIKKIVL